MLNMNCPSCGAAGRVPEDKINARLHCKKCLSVFHLTPLGNPVLGPPPASAEELEPIRRKKADHQEEVEQLIEAVKDVPQKLVKPLAVVAGLLLLYGAYQYVLPTGINTRATQAAMALTNPDPRVLQDLSLPGTGAATLAWYAGVRAKHKEFLVDQSKPQIQITDVNNDPARGLAEATVVLSEREDTSRSNLTTPNLSVDYGGERTIEVRIVLSGGGLSGWRVDGGKTLESFKQSSSQDLAKTTKE